MAIDFSILISIGAILITSTALLYIIRVLKQPSILAYVIAGLILGPIGLQVITGQNEIMALGELGVAFLLFGIGLEIDFRALKDVGLAAITGGVVQILLMLGGGIAIALGLGFGWTIALYVGLLLTFSSTMIVTKTLMDRDEIKSIHGRVMLGILVLQDIVAITALSLMADIGNPSIFSIVFFIIKGVGLFGIGIILNKYVFSKVFDYAAKSHEILFLTALATLFGFIGLAHYLGFSMAIGAFIAGLSMANFPYNIEISGEASALRNFFSIIFFATLGMQLDFLSLASVFWLFVWCLFGLMFLKPLVLYIIYNMMGYGKRVATSVGIGLSQGSEFFFIIAAQALFLGHIGHNLYSMFITLIVVSMIATPYLMKSKNRVYHIVSGMNKKIKVSPISKNLIEEMENEPKKMMKDHVVLFGSHRMGENVVKYLSSIGENFIVVDQDPQILKKMKSRGIFCIYGDAENGEVLKKANVKQAKIVISTIPDIYASSFIISRTKRENRKVKMIARAHSKDEAISLYKAGCDFVLVPEFVTANEIVKFISQFLEEKK